MAGLRAALAALAALWAAAAAAAAEEGVLPFALSLTLEVPEAGPGPRPEQGVRSGAEEGAPEGPRLAELMAALNSSLGPLREALEVRLVSRELAEEQRSGQQPASRVLRLRLEGSLPRRPAAGPARSWLFGDDLDLSPLSIFNFFVEMGATLFGLSFGIYSLWLAG